MVYVLSASGKPLMPTKRFGHVRRILRGGRAKVVRRTPFTIQLTYDGTAYTQPISLGVNGNVCPLRGRPGAEERHHRPPLSEEGVETFKAQPQDAVPQAEVFTPHKVKA